jgi:hypothetical protein
VPHRRRFYIAVLGRQIPLDVVVEQDAAGGILEPYDVLCLAGRHVSRAAAARLARWVEARGRLFAIAGAGMCDEYDRPNRVLPPQHLPAKALEVRPAVRGGDPRDARGLLRRSRGPRLPAQGRLARDRRRGAGQRPRARIGCS